VDRPELWGLLDSLARRHPPGGHYRLSKDELLEWLGFVAENPKADRDTRKQAKTALKWVPKLIGPYYEVAYAPLPPPPPPPLPEPKRERRSVQLELFD